MSIRGFSPITGIQSKPKYYMNSMVQRPPKSVRTHSEKKFTPQINKSFTCYNDNPNQNNQSFTGEKSRNISLAHLKSRNTSLGKYQNFRSIPKLYHKDPHKKEITTALLEKAQVDIKAGDYRNAINYLNKVIKEESNNPEALYSRGKCYINLSSYKEAIPDLLSLIQDYPMYEKNAYVALAMSFVAVNDYNAAVRQLSKALIKFPKFKDAYLTRGQLLTHQKIWDKAISDFYKVINLAPDDGNAYIGLSDALIGMGDYQNSLKVLNSASKCKNISNQAYLRRGKIFYDINNFKQALKELNKSIQASPLDAESYYYKALVQLNLENLTEAALCLEQVVKYDVDKKFTGAAIYDLGAIKIKQKDYYGAMHTFQRATDTNVEIKQQKILVTYVEAILTLMKRKFADGAGLLSKIIKHNHPLIQEYIGNCYTFRGYAYAAQEFHDKATKDLSIASKMQKLDSASEYNYLISQALVQNDKKPDQALSLLEKSKEFYPKNPEPLVFQACILFYMKLMEKSKDLLNHAIDLKPGDSDLHFFRSILNYSSEKYSEAIQDLEIAIDKAEDNNVYQYLCRGLCYAELGMYSEAINDFSAVMQLDENLSQAFLYRGRCAFMQDDINLAYTDFQKLLYAKPDDYIVHVQAGDLLMLTQCTEDAIKAYNNSLTKQKNKEAFIQRTKCYILLNNLELAIASLLEAQKHLTDKLIELDLNIFQALKLMTDHRFTEAVETLQALSGDGYLLKQHDIKKYIGVSFFYLKEYQYAQAIFQSSVENQENSQIELLYNLALTNIMEEYYESALTQLSEISQFTEGPDKGKILLLVGCIHLGLENKLQGAQYLSEAYKFDPGSVTSYRKQNSSISILPFNSSSLFASECPLVKVCIGNSTPVFVRPSFCLPVVELPAIEFDIDPVILAQFQLKNIKSKPEAPWLNRVQGMIQFTDEIQDILSETVAESVADEEEQHLEDVFEEGIENFKKFRSAFCLPKANSGDLLKNIQAVFESNNQDLVEDNYNTRY